ncbi:MAG: cytochrome ubiquinol oxidase subunit I [Gammaproteobacteria bacterium]|nr:cytochrome ubiquinol oxidase subunit I [Gammaproteobacteria bacterium]MDH3450538.1 cytochrome ubiquinol oxidase subunit I [Gammaproteobacteria bacterium]
MAYPSSASLVASNPPIWRRLLPLLLIICVGLGGAVSGGGASAATHAAEAQTAMADSATGDEPAAAEALPAPKPRRGDYPNIGVSSRGVVWIFAQMHLFFGALVLAVPIFVLVIEFIGFKTRDDRYDDMAHEFMKVSLTAYAITALFGGTLALSLFLLYPQFMSYMMRTFGSQVLIYALLFFLESMLLYIYYYGWDALRYGNRKWVHLTLGLLLNGVGTTLLVVANSWSTFMMAPSGIDPASGAITGNLWEIMKGPLWNPLNLHRFLANIAFGGAVVGAYAAFKFLAAKTAADRAHYDWMGYTSNFVAILAFLPLPFAGYWLMAEVYAYSQQMGILAMGGILAWLFVIQAVLICTILLAANYYLWNGMARTDGGERYRWMIKYIALVLILGFLVWVTPHNVIYSGSELARLGGGHHPVLGPLGIMPAKNIAVFLMLVMTFLSFQLYRRADKEITVGWKHWGNALMIAIYVVACANIVFAGVYYGYFTNTVYKVGSSVLQVMSTVVVILSGVVIDTLMFKGAKKLPVHWGEVSNRSQYALFALPIAFTWLMALMGYIRSSVRTHWHVYAVMKDNSPDNFIPPLATVGNMVTGITLLFLVFVLFIFWIANLSGTRQLPPQPHGEVALAGGVK